MKTKILTMLLEPSVYEAIRRAAYEAHCSMGEIARRAVAEYLGKRPRKREKKGGA